MPDDANDYLRLMLQELKALNLRLDRTLDRVEAIRADLKAEWRSVSKRLDAARSEIHTDLSVLRGEVMQLRGVTSSRLVTVEERLEPAGGTVKAKPAKRTRTVKPTPRGKRTSSTRKKAQS